MVKKTNLTLENKLKSYSALAAGVIASGASVQAQIVYTDVDPDITLSDTVYLLNMNKDTIIDFRLVQADYFYYSTSFLNIVGVQALDKNEILGDTVNTSSDYNFYPKALQLNDTIAAKQKIWMNSYSAPMYIKGAYYGYNINQGNWKNVTDRYLGLRFKIGNEWHYGWARLDVAQNATSFTLKDYAYESVPNKRIIAGMKVSAIVDNSELSVGIFHSKQQLNIIIPEGTIAGNALIYNSLGEKISQLNLSNGRNYLNTNQFKSGIYIINVEINGKMISKKILIR